MARPQRVMRPKMTSYQMILRLKNRGSIKATKREVEASVVSVIDTLETLRDSKNKIQWPAVTTPVAKYLRWFFQLVRMDRWVMTMNMINPSRAIDMRHHTRLNDEMLMSLPKMPVNPQRKMTPCRLSRDWFFLDRGFKLGPQVL